MKWEVGGPNSNHAALILNGQESKIQSSNFVKSDSKLKKSEVWSRKTLLDFRTIRLCTDLLSKISPSMSRNGRQQG